MRQLKYFKSFESECNAIMKEDYPYDNTVDESHKRSLEKALAIFAEQQEEYKREESRIIKRPDISVKKGLLYFVTALLAVFLLFPGLLSIFIDSRETRILIALILSVLIFIINARRIIKWLIYTYQKLAPDELRLACVFEPSCSEYMLIAIEKFGVVHGITKGIKRLLRCHYPNSGVDNP